MTPEVAATLDLVPDAVLIHQEGTWVYANPVAAELFGAPNAGDLVGRSMFDYIPPADRAAVAERIRRRISGDPLPPRDEKLIRYDGRQIDVRILPRPIAINGDVGVILVIRDITERVALQERFRKLVENAFDAIEVLDSSGTITYISHASESLLGYPTADLLGHSVFALVHPDDLPKAVEEFQRLCQTPGRTSLEIFRLRSAGGEWRMIEGVAVNMLGDPEVAGIVLNARDVTERVELARNLDRMHRIESLGKVASKVTHEINNLLMSIAPWAEVLKRQFPNDETIRKAAASLTAAVKNGRRLTEQIRQFGKQAEISKRPVAVSGWLRDLAHTLHGVVPEPIQLGVDTAPDVGTVAFDADLIGQVLLNLVINARDAMPDGGRIDVAARMAPNHVFEIVVRDDGAGMAEDMLERIFEPFFTTKKSGTGLGLAVCQQIVNSHGGRIRVESQLGAGTAFSIVLPAS